MVQQENDEISIIGFIRLAKIDYEGEVKVYLSDEVVVHDNDEEREQRLAILFGEVRKYLNTIPNLKMVYIRAAPGKEAMYERLGCSKENPGIIVLHGNPTKLLNSKDNEKEVNLNSYVKGIAREKIIALSPGKQESSLFQPILTEAKKLQEKAIIKPEF